jgi:hypothetical protein
VGRDAIIRCPGASEKNYFAPGIGMRTISTAKQAAAIPEEAQVVIVG